MKTKEIEGKAAEGAPVLGLRARGKERRRNRIKDAAREVFVERGYELATTREIAERAEVSLGTLFAYAPTKSELLLMIVNDDLEEIRLGALVEVPDDVPLIDALVALAREDMAYWSKYPEIARQARREIAGVLLGRAADPEAMRFAAMKPRLLTYVAGLIARKQELGQLTTKAPADLVANLWWAIYNQNLHDWLMVAKPNPRQGVAGLRRLLELAFEGLSAPEKTDGAPKAKPRAPRKTAAKAAQSA